MRYTQNELCAKLPEMTSVTDYFALVAHIKSWGSELGFADVRIADLHLPEAEKGLQTWLAAGRHGEMGYMAAHGMLRARPAELVPGAQRVIVARMDYLPRGSFDVAGDQHEPHPLTLTPPLSQRERVSAASEKSEDFSRREKQDWREREQARLRDPMAASISMYARGRDYHRVLRARLQQLADRIALRAGPFTYRVFTDSAPVMEVALAEKSGLGWRGKHTLLLQREGGSMFFLGEILVDLPLPVDAKESGHCGRCEACLRACPTQAIMAPYQLDARRCISYLTIEHPGSIPVAMRPLMGNRIYGCDDCQLACPWNRFAKTAGLPDFDVRHDLDSSTLLAVWAWTETDFNTRLAGSPIRRMGHERWLRNIAVALGNALRGRPPDEAQAQAIRAALQTQIAHPSEMVREHVQWALAQR